MNMTNSSRITKKWGAQAVVTGLALFACVLSCQGQVIIIDLPDLLLQPNTPNQSFDLFVQNEGAAFPVTGILTQLQVADGGPEAGGSIDGPNVSNVDVITGTIFASNNNGPSGAGAITPQIYERGTLTLSGTVDIPAGPGPGGSSKFATITFDTTGFFSGTFGFTADTLNGATVYHTSTGDFTPNLIDGTLTVVPEPSHYAAIAGAGCLIWAVVRRRKSASAA